MSHGEPNPMQRAPFNQANGAVSNDDSSCMLGLTLKCWTTSCTNQQMI
jgi:hypothetical protein